jgi:anti-sigma B factor antagonist
MPSPIDIVERSAGDVTILELKGRLVDDPDQVFREAMNRVVNQGRLKVVLNFELVDYVDSAGLGMLVSRFIRLSKHDGRLKLCNLHPRSFRVLDITKLLTVFETYASEDEAVRSFEDHAPT